ncbi:class I SAM-dependent methyltransferase [Sneathiella chinensis]|uniref:SAM-dependent methyltransferase n=1 Tax=Sneathiella chinensis TaxID=349750 RepID=A0ABQ5U805_9PROT|nr:class I SAM-dependent methyltransferase [Sneathiella chinensis]GLQ07921.1 SAM-dependent methyltransferase [Sneathiella chinensis]
MIANGSQKLKNPPSLQETPEYFGHLRSDVLAHVPDALSSALSIGCGQGRTERELVEKGCRVVGIEPSQEAASRASLNGIDVIVDTAENGVKKLQGQQFDCLILSDVLEHLVDPEATLAQCLPLLRPGGRIIISIPNFRHYSVFHALFLKGVVPDRDAGIFDRTHLRITTRKLVERWYGTHLITASPPDYQFSGRLERGLATLCFGLMNEFLARQVIVSGTKTR